MKVVVSRAALADIRRLHDFLDDKNSEAARHAVAAIKNAIQSLEHMPSRGRPSGISGVRELFAPFGNSSYVIRFEHFAEDHVVVVLRVWHGREDRPL